MAVQTHVLLQCCIEKREGQEKKKKRVQDPYKLILLPNSLCYQALPVSVALPFLSIPS